MLAAVGEDLFTQCVLADEARTKQRERRAGPTQLFPAMTLPGLTMCTCVPTQLEYRLNGGITAWVVSAGSASSETR